MKILALRPRKITIFIVPFVLLFQIINIYPSQAASTYTFTQISSIPIFNTFNTRTIFKGSSDGTKIVAASAGLYLSTNSGATFTSILPSAWSATAAKISSAWISDNGTKIVAVQNQGGIAVSTDTGATWTYQVLNQKFVDVSASANMQYIYAITDVSTLYTSADSGASWTSTATGGAGSPFTSGTFGDSQIFISVQSSADGMNVQIVGRTDFYRSQNGGTTWASTLNIGGENASCCFYSAMSQSGQVVVVGFNGKGFYLSKNYGSTFTQIPMSTFNGHPGRTEIYGYGSGVSQDGTQLVVYDFGKYVYISNDGGTTWQAQADLGVNSWSGGAFISNTGNALVQSNLAAGWITGASGVTYRLTNGNATPVVTLDGTAAEKREAEKREAEKIVARTDLVSKLKNAKDLTVDSFARAEIPGITSQNIVAVQAELLALPEKSRADITQVLKVARKYEVVGMIASDRVAAVYSKSLIEVGLIPADSKNKAAITSAIKKLPVSDRSSYAAIKVVVDTEMAEIQARKDRLTAILALIKSRRNG